MSEVFISIYTHTYTYIALLNEPYTHNIYYIYRVTSDCAAKVTRILFHKTFIYLRPRKTGVGLLARSGSSYANKCIWYEVMRDLGTSMQSG